jgi:hypothetical protein
MVHPKNFSAGIPHRRCTSISSIAAIAVSGFLRANACSCLASSGSSAIRNLLFSICPAQLRRGNFALAVSNSTPAVILYKREV